MKRLCTICVRAGSKGVKNKNVRNLLGKPLFTHSILQAKESKMFDLIVVSSDSLEILEIAKQWGTDLTIHRPAELAADDTPKIPVIQHALIKAELTTAKSFNVVVDLDATSPLRNLEDIQEAIGLLETKRVSNVISVTPSRRLPYFNMVEIDGLGKVKLCKSMNSPIIRRQDSPPCYDLNASIYAWQRDTLLESTALLHPDTMLYVMPMERSVDIDSETDWEIVSYLMQKKGKEHE